MKEMRSLKGKSILVVDDEEWMREALESFLKLADAHVETAQNGEEAFSILLSKKFDALITDLRMPGGHGAPLIKRVLLELAIKPKVFVCSGYCDFSKEEAREMGIVRVFGKPFDGLELVDAVAEAVS
jgi:DNA-binding NtrC family response regulator